MTTQYIILSKDDRDAVQDNKKNQFFHINRAPCYFLPAHNHDYYVKHGLFESGLIEWCKQFCNPNSVFLDIGAHTGTYAISLAHFAKKVYAFEPQRMTYYALCGGVALSNMNNIDCINYGLGSDDQVGTQTLNLVSADGGGSTLQKVQCEIIGKERVEVRRLDDMQIQSPISFIKMDIEGNELNAIKGGVETLRRNNYPRILFESNCENVELFKFIQDLGYKIISVSGTFNMFLATKEGR
jgi:FkbM family methyltransferase